MKNFKSIFMYLIIAILLLSINMVLFAAASEVKVFKLGHMRPNDSIIHESAVYFANEVEKRTNGRVKIEIYGANQLGDYELMCERVSLGDVEMFLGSIGKNVDKTLTITGWPYLASTWDEAEKLWNTQDGIIANYIAVREDKLNNKLLAAHPMYFGSLAFVKEPADPHNPNADRSGIKIRVPSDIIWEKVGGALGFITTPLSSTENFTSLQTGIINGILGGGTEYYWGQMKDLVKYIMPINLNFNVQYLIINKEVFNDLSPEDQKVFLDVAKEFEENAFIAGRRDADKYDDLFKQAGVTVYEYSDEELNLFANKIRNEVWPEITYILGDAQPVLEEAKKQLGISE